MRAKIAKAGFIVFKPDLTDCGKEFPPYNNSKLLIQNSRK